MIIEPRRRRQLSRHGALGPRPCKGMKRALDIERDIGDPYARAGIAKKHKLQTNVNKSSTAATPFARKALVSLQEALQSMDKVARLNTIQGLPPQARAALLNFMRDGDAKRPPGEEIAEEPRCTNQALGHVAPICDRLTRVQVKQCWTTRHALKRKCVRAAGRVVDELAVACSRHQLTSLSLQEHKLGKVVAPGSQLLFSAEYRRQWECLGTSVVEEAQC